MALLVLAAGLSCNGESGSASADPPVKDTSPSGPQTLNFEMIANYNFLPGVAVPGEVKKLDGKRFEITGYIYPTRQTRNIREFILMKDRGTCCYGPKTQWSHFLQVTIPKDKDPISYTTDPVTVIGTFRVDPQVEDDWILGLYFLDVEEHRR